MHAWALSGTRFTIGSALLLSLIPLALPAQSGVPAALTQARAVHDLPHDLAARHLPVHLLATVTYYEPQENTLFVADASGAVYVKTTQPYPIHRGDLVRLDGTTSESYRTTVGRNPVIQVIGRGTMHRDNIRTSDSYQELMSGKWDCRYVTVRGQVRSAQVELHNQAKVLELEVQMPGGLVQTYLQDYAGIDLGRLNDAEVEVSGIVAGDFNAQWQLMRSVLYGADASDLKILEEPRIKPESLPLTSIDNVMQTHAVSDLTKRVRVRGTVTYFRSGSSVVIQQGDRGLFASTRQMMKIPFGAVVDLIGFADEGGYGPSLGQAEIVPTGQFAPVQPREVTYDQAIGGHLSDNLISVRGRILSQLHTDTSDALQLMLDGHPVSVVLRQPEQDRWLRRLPIGADVTVTGICRITPTNSWGTPGVTPMLFRLDMRSSDDLKIVALPSWWTVAHLVIVLGALGLLSLMIAFWAVILRRRVAHQTAMIERTMRLEMERSRLLEAINSETALDRLLEKICSSIEALIPGLRCSCTIDDFSFETSGPARALCIGAAADPAIFETALMDSKGRRIGHFRAGSEQGHVLSAYESEVLMVGTGLANLAVNQCRMYQELNYTSTHDQLTGLPNRRLADLTLDLALEQAAANGSRLAVAYIDVDRFKQVNDQHGHKTGDLYLQQIASRLTAQVRPVDRLARIGGDEFILIAAGLVTAEEGDAYRRTLGRCFEHSFVLDGCRLCGSASIGIAVFPDHGSTAEELKRHADIDMYSAKHRRRAEQDSRAPALTETNIFSVADLESALESNRFLLYYQPQFSSRGELRGLEALIRLKDPILGIVTPDAFIGVAERNELILPLGAWVLRRALADAAAWNLQRDPEVRIIVNVSARQIEHAGFADEVNAALAEFGIPASSLELEITERTLARDIAEAKRQFSLLHTAGVRLSIDDFGTEHSCLSALHQFPFDTLKIDRSFVRSLAVQPETTHILGAIVSMGAALNKRIVAEGIEDTDDIERLLALGEMDLQGYYFSRPKPFEEISAHLTGWRTGVVVPR